MLTTVQTVTYWCETSLTGVVHLLLVIAILVTAYKFTYGVSAGSKSSVTETMQSGDSIAPNPQMESHLMRLATFRSLPESASLSPSMASKAGLYYTGEGDTVACYSCGLRLNHLESGVQPMTVHRQLSPECQFVVSQQSHSAPIGRATRQGRSAPVQVSQTAVNSRAPEQMSTDDIMSHTSRQPVQVTSSEGVSQAVSTSRAPVQVTTSEDVSQDIPTSRAPEETILPSRNRNRHRGPRRRPNSRPNYYSMLASVAGGGNWSAYVDNSRSSQPSSRHHDTVDGLTHIMDRINDISDSPGTGHLSGMVDSPTHFAERVNNNDPTLLVEMKYERRRLATYSNWPRDVVNISPEALAQAGLFYLGLADRVKCPFCGGILRNWEPSDEPMREHRRNFPHCIFVRDARAAGNVAIGEEPTLTQTLVSSSFLYSRHMLQYQMVCRIV